MSEGSWRSPSAASARGTGRCPLDSVLPHPGKPRTVWVRLGLGNRPPAPTPRAAPALSRPHLSGAPGAAVLTSPAGSRGAPDAMARGSEGAGPGRPEAVPSAGGASAARPTAPLFRLPSGRQEVRHRNAPWPALLRGRSARRCGGGSSGAGPTRRRPEG